MTREYLRSIKRTIFDNGPAFGYTITITGSAATLASTAGSPSGMEVILGSLSAAVGFSILELIGNFVLRGEEEETEKVVQLGNSLNILSVTVSVSAVFAIASWLDKTAAWVAGPFAATVLYATLAVSQLSAVRIMRKNRK
ncbi:hypothetical protein KY385_00370 [Candidatus Parcubacteria bacterium]|nr:hypothetical protein [Candidatus Parcubacteria bacterium]